MDFTVSFLPVLFITGALTALFLLLALAVQQPASARDRIRNLTSTSNRPEGPVNRNVEKPLRDRLFKPVLSGIGAAAEKIGLAGDSRLVQEKLANAGGPRFLGAPLGVREYVALKLVSLVLAGLVLIYLLRNPLMDGLAGVMAMMLIVLVIGMAPTLILDRLVDARKAKISRSLPDILDLLVVSAEAGLSLDAAMTRVRKAQGPAGGVPGSPAGDAAGQEPRGCLAGYGEPVRGQGSSDGHGFHHPGGADGCWHRPGIADPGRHAPVAQKPESAGAGGEVARQDDFPDDVLHLPGSVPGGGVSGNGDADARPWRQQLGQPTWKAKAPVHEGEPGPYAVSGCQAAVGCFAASGAGTL